jgi:hypothetical protein
MLVPSEPCDRRWCHSPLSRRLIGSCEIVSNPGFKSERSVRRRLTALQGEVAGADQVAHYAVADPNHEVFFATGLAFQ